MLFQGRDKEFQEGDTVRQLVNCSGAIKGCTYVLSYVDGENNLFTMNSRGRSLCCCKNFWELVKPAPQKKFKLFKSTGITRWLAKH